jgi:hypothetical protein
MGGFGRVLNGLGLQNSIAYLNPFNKVDIIQTQSKPTQLSKLKPNSLIYLFILCVYIIKMS